MRRLPAALLRRMAERLPDEQRDEMAIPSYLHRNPLMRWMAWRRVEVVARHLEQVAARYPADRRLTVLDFGCGSGVLFEQALRHAGRVYGVDVVLDAAKLLVEEWGLSGVELLTPDDVRERVARGSVDVILAAEVLEHIEPLRPTLELFDDLLKPGGALLVSLPTESPLYRLGRRLAGFRGHYHHSDAAAVHAELLDYGFAAERLEKVPAPGPLAIYWVIDYRRPVR